jgi:ferrous iron transport protein A
MGLIFPISINITLRMSYLCSEIDTINILMYKKLSEIKIGQNVIIKEFGNDDLFLKLMEMGCIPGEKVTVEQIAPLKDPISITVSGYLLSLRLDEAEHILVEEV